MTARHVVHALKVVRPKQWIKNLLVFAAPIAATESSSNIPKLVIAFGGFTCASVCGYLINDWFDRENDRFHRDKRFRPFASGALGMPSLLMLIFFFTSGLIASCYYLGSSFVKIVSFYLVITISYTLWIKKVAVLEMFWLALGFLARAIAGSTVIGAPPTGWFLLAVFSGALFLTSCKRRSEIENESSGVGETRKVLSQYSLTFLDSVSAVFAGVTAVTYSLWVLQEHSDSYVAYASIVPFFCALVSYFLMSSKGKAEAPELDLFSNKLVFSMGLITLLMLLTVFYL